MPLQSPSSSQPVTDAKCQLLEIVQYACEPEKASNGDVRTHCFPFSRIFRICAHGPAVEITRYVAVDPKTGEIQIPDGASGLVKGTPWRDIRLNDDESEQRRRR